MAAVIRNGKYEEIEDGDTPDYEIISGSNLLSSHANHIPMLSAVQSGRSFYGSRFLNQAPPLKNAEAPLVQALVETDPDGQSFDDIYGKFSGSLKADDDYDVLDVKDERLKLRRKSTGETVEKRYYATLPYNRKSQFSQTPLVKPGDSVKKGGMLLKSNFTDTSGALSLGRNARVGIVPYLGYSADDAMVISSDFAKAMTHSGIETLRQDTSDNYHIGRDHFSSLFSDKFTIDQLKHIDENGLPVVGSVVRPGDPLILATKPRTYSSVSGLGRLSKVMREARADASQTWDHDVDGTVQAVAKTKDGWKVIMAYDAPTAVGDKLVFRSGHKGVVAKIIDQEKMPRTADGQPLEMLLNPQGLPSRTNVALPYELMLGKVAAKLGAPIKVPAFSPAGTKWHDIVESKLRENGLTDTEVVFDPTINRKLENPIMVGNGYVMKLHHVSSGKISGRGQGAYDLNNQPVKGGSEGAKRVSGLEVYALMSSGAYGLLKEKATVTGEKNDDYVRELRAGNNPAAPGEPFVFQKFRALLNGAGMYAKDEGRGELRLGPMTDATLAGFDPIEVKSGDLVNRHSTDPDKFMAPIPGGLFDEALVSGNRWGKITLPEPVLNPAFENVTRNLLGLKKKDLSAVLSGEMPLPQEHIYALQRSGYKGPDSGPLAVKAALAGLDLTALEKKQRQVISGGAVSKRDAAVKTLNAIAGLRKNKVTPDALMVSSVPVLPPQFRPFGMTEGGVFIAGDANMLYSDLFDMRDAYHENVAAFGSPEPQARKALQNAVRAVYGYGEPVNAANAARGVSGFLQTITGSSPKFGWVQRKLISKPQDNVGRGVIVPDPELSMDEVGLPENMAWPMFSTLVRRRLVMDGVPRSQAIKLLKDKDPLAKRALLREMEERNVVYARSPAWHRTNVIAGKARLVDGDAIRISPFVTTGMNADFDGDTGTVHLPMTDAGVKEAKTTLLPSSMLFSIRSQNKLVPNLKQEQVLGIYAANERPAQTKYVFRNAAEALAQIRAGKVKLSDDITFAP